MAKPDENGTGAGKSRSYKIVLSHRRECWSSGWVQILYDKLAERYGQDAVFLDLESIGIENFPKAISVAISQASVLLVVIGKDWAGQDGQIDRICDPRDFVRQEVQVGYQRYLKTKGMPHQFLLFPIFINDARIPNDECLEAIPCIKYLKYQNGINVRADRDLSGIERVFKHLDAHCNPPKSDARVGSNQGKKSSLALLSLAILGLLVALIWWLPPYSPKVILDPPPKRPPIKQPLTPEQISSLLKESDSKNVFLEFSNEQWGCRSSGSLPEDPGKIIYRSNFPRVSRISDTEVLQLLLVTNSKNIYGSEVFLARPEAPVFGRYEVDLLPFLPTMEAGRRFGMGVYKQGFGPFISINCDQDSAGAWERKCTFGVLTGKGSGEIRESKTLVALDEPIRLTIDWKADSIEFSLSKIANNDLEPPISQKKYQITDSVPSSSAPVVLHLQHWSERNSVLRASSEISVLNVVVP